MWTKSHLLDLGTEIAAFLLAATCAGCDEPGTLLCGRCLQALRPDPRRLATPEGLPVTAALSFEGVAAQCIRRLKGKGETLLARPLGAALASVLDSTETASRWIVPVPTSRTAFRRRGYRVPDLLIRRADAEPRRLLSVVGGTSDQRGLGARARATNMSGAMRVRRAGEGTEVVIVDDVVTTGATFDEAARALTAAGFHVSAAVALAATPRRDGFG
ncbi:ComF family protein [Microbacterium oxydans]|uniref:ComF family protein n=1 Tax=Microbacterium oxydans TaxID=82380 RepID=UPI00366D3BD9